MDLIELLRSQAKRYRCTSCGKSMADCGINVLAQQGNRALVRVTCHACNDENLLQIIFQTDEDAVKTRRVPAIDEGYPQHDGEINADEVLELHQLLQEDNVTFTELLARK